jgi:C4-dicarboxylate-specific signal transduction histidine kinase
VAEGLIRSAGGRLSLDGNSSAGATFVIELPAAAVSAPAEPTGAASV